MKEKRKHDKKKKTEMESNLSQLLDRNKKSDDDESQKLEDEKKNDIESMNEEQLIRERTEPLPESGKNAPSSSFSFFSQTSFIF